MGLIRHCPQHYVQIVSKCEETIASHAVKILFFLTISFSAIIPIVIPPIAKVLSGFCNTLFPTTFTPQKINQKLAVTI